MSHTHNLDIQSYTFYEVLELFDLDSSNVTLDDIKRAKKKVLMLHPDKSKLPPEYFLFYKKAFDIVVRLYENVQRVTQEVENKDYIPDKTSTCSKEFQKTLDKVPQKKFQENFNALFEKHMKTPVNTDKNAWFVQEDALYSDKVANSSQMSSALERIKDQQQSLVKYNGVTPLNLSSSGNSFYEDETDDYICSDPFSKLKFDDLRKVHKDQTVFSVRESDLQNVPKYRNVDEYQRARNVREVQPMDRSKAQKMMDENEKYLQEKIRQKQFASEMQTMKHIQSNKEVMSNFLRLT